MKQFSKTIIALCVASFAIWGGSVNAQCTNSNPYGTPSAPSPGSSILAVSCQYASEYSELSGVVSGNTYSVGSSIPQDYITVRSGTPSGPVVAFGPAPLVWTAAASGTVFVHINTNASCGTASSCRDIDIGCYTAGCTNTIASTSSLTAPAPTQTTSLACQTAEEYVAINTASAGYVYVNTSSVGTDYLTIRSGSFNGPIVATGISPLTWTAQVSGTHFVHITTSTLCATDATCRANSLTCLGTAVPQPPANDQCSNAIALAVPSTSAGTTDNATSESPAPQTCGTSLNTPGVWYTVVGNGNQFGASLCGTSGLDSKIFVYTGSCGSWNCVTGNDDGGPLCSGSAASATWCSVPTTTYYIVVAAYTGTSDFTLAVTQTVITAPSLSVTIASNSICPGIATIGTASGASTYSWSTGATTSSVSLAPSVATVYTITGRDATGCGITAVTRTINMLTTPVIGVTNNTAAICPGGSFVITPNGASTYTYAGGTATLTGTSATVSPIVNTTYTISGTGSNGCRNTATAVGFATVTTLSSPSINIVATPTAVCPGFASSITATGANTYTWVAPSSNASLISVSPSVTTIYTVSGTGTTVCNGVKTITITVFQTPTVVATPSVLVRCALSTATLSATGAATYTWNGSITTNTASIVTPTANSVYTVVGTSANGCLGTTTVAVTSNSLPILAITPAATTICAQSFASFTVSGASSYLWNNSVPGSTVNLFHPTSTTHTIVGTDALGCTKSATVGVFANPLPAVAITPSLITVCANSPVSFTASGALTYTWSNATNGTNATFTPSVSSQYNVSGTDANGCVNSAPTTVLTLTLPTITVAAPANTVCANSVSNFTASGATTYTWSTGSNGAVVAITPTSNSTYTLSGTDGTTSCVNTMTFAVNTFTSPIISIAPNASQSVCVNGSTSYTATGGNTYLWNNGVAGPVLVITPTANAVYTVTAKNQFNCTSSKTVSIKLYSLTVVSASASSPTICAKETVTLTANGALTYTWLPFGTTGNTSILSPLSTLKYTLIGVDANNCEGIDSVKVTVDKCTGINESSFLNSQVKLYPNPSNGQFTIEMPFSGTKHVSVYNVTGALISEISTLEESQKVNLSEAAKGVYFIQINAAGATARYKAIVE